MTDNKSPSTLHGRYGNNQQGSDRTPLSNNNAEVPPSAKYLYDSLESGWGKTHGGSDNDDAEGDKMSNDGINQIIEQKQSHHQDDDQESQGSWEEEEELQHLNKLLDKIPS